jgi:arginine utilization regulatory protein
MSGKNLTKVLSGLLNHLGVDMFSFYDDLHEGVIITDVTGKILYYNATQAKIDDIDREYATGKKITDLYKLSENGSTTMQCIRTGLPVKNKMMVYRTRLGKIANTISNVFPLFHKNEASGAISFTKDYQMLETILEMGVPLEAPQRFSNGTRFTFDDIIGSDHSLLESVEIAKLASDSPSPIMLSGETGTGKELFAQSIHNYSSQSKENFIPVNCAAIPENLLEGILFGTSKGAFTGSVDKSGLFEQANGGTLFLDELDSMPLSLQAKLLRVVQEKKVRRLGSSREIDLNLKIISTVSQDPHQIIKRALLRLDLFYRMGVVMVMIPPLRHRRNDIQPLIDQFVAKFNEILGERVAGVSSKVLALFSDYDWPGNVRELEHVIEGAMNLVNGSRTIKLKHLPPHVCFCISGVSAQDELPGPSPFQGEEKKEGRKPSEETAYSPYKEKLNLVENQTANEIEIIVNALKKSKGNAAKAARSLGISPQSFHYKLKKYDLDRKQFLE